MGRGGSAGRVGAADAGGEAGEAVGGCPVRARLAVGGVRLGVGNGALVSAVGCGGGGNEMNCGHSHMAND